MRLHRLIAILLLIESRGRMKAKDLAYALETSVRSIYRDIDVLAEAGIPIVTISGPSGGIQLMEGYTVNLKQLNGDEVIHLYLTGMGVYAGGQTETGLKLKNALLKLEKTLPPSYQTDIQKAKARFYFDDAPWWTQRAAIPSLEALRAAVWRSQKLRIAYTKVSGACSVRIVYPYGLVVKTADWYLEAYCAFAGEIRTFKCERITTAEPIGEPFEIPPDFSLEEHWNRQAADFKQGCRVREYYPVKIKLRMTNKTVKERLEVIGSRQAGEYFLLTVNLYSYERACRDIVDLLGHIEVIEPEMLRVFAKEKVTGLVNMYA
ncbi:helix-turn-helix transcriptional regulator [Brevibacillus sp. NRS-1366]|uniref:helix-turn-helix transcriptional regulator n=1 Tax=Brevibacillus sp. NRS-1366 TaxID=3233899 RepID=UPI003D23E181